MHAYQSSRLARHDVVDDCAVEDVEHSTRKLWLDLRAFLELSHSSTRHAEEFAESL